jgi:cysteine desulfurase/selenocysteine lyase
MRRLGAPASTRAAIAIHNTHEDNDRQIDGLGTVQRIFA